MDSNHVAERLDLFIVQCPTRLESLHRLLTPVDRLLTELASGHAPTAGGRTQIDGPGQMLSHGLIGDGGDGRLSGGPDGTRRRGVVMSYAVITTVAMQPGAIDEAARLFAETNPGLVAGEDDWRGAQFTADREANTITVIAQWSDAASYHRLRTSAEFRAAMARFGPLFAGPPDVRVHEVLVDM